MKLLIANGYVIDPAQQINAGRNVLIDKGRVVGLLDRSELAPEDAHVLDATGLIVAPGFIAQTLAQPPATAAAAPVAIVSLYS